MRKPTESPLSASAIDAVTVEGRNATVTVLEVSGLWFTGEAKREPQDVTDSQIARDLSLARAFQQAAQFFEHRARVCSVLTADGSGRHALLQRTGGVSPARPCLPGLHAVRAFLAKVDWLLFSLGAGLILASLLFQFNLARTWNNGFTEGTQNALGIFAVACSFHKFWRRKP